MPASSSSARSSSKVRLRFGIEMIQQHRRFFDHGLHGRVLAVQNPQRIGEQPPPAVFVQFGAPRGEIADQPVRGRRRGPRWSRAN
jgi:hypothetical protein